MRVDTVLISAQHREEVDVETLLAPDVTAEVIDPVLREFPELDASGVRVLVNPTGRFEIGGPKADTGLTGRKIIVDTYGGYAPHGGGAFSGKDPTKVDRSAAYMARYVAKNIVAAGLADRAQLQVAYAIGTAHPVSLMIDTFGTEQVDPAQLQGALWELFDFRPAAIIRDLDLAPPALPRDRRLRALRAQGVPLGGDRPRRRPPRRVRLRSSPGRSRSASTGRSSPSTGRSRTSCPPSSAPVSAPSCRCPSTDARCAAGCSARPRTSPTRMLAVKKAVSPERVFDEELLDLARWVSERYVAPLAAVLGRLAPPRVAAEEGLDRGTPGAVVGAAADPRGARVLPRRPRAPRGRRPRPVRARRPASRPRGRGRRDGRAGGGLARGRPSRDRGGARGDARARHRGGDRRGLRGPRRPLPRRVEARPLPDVARHRGGPVRRGGGHASGRVRPRPGPRRDRGIAGVAPRPPGGPGPVLPRP